MSTPSVPAAPAPLALAVPRRPNVVRMGEVDRQLRPANTHPASRARFEGVPAHAFVTARVRAVGAAAGAVLSNAIIGHEFTRHPRPSVDASMAAPKLVRQRGLTVPCCLTENGHELTVARR